MIHTTNKRVGCAPFQNRNVKSQVVSKGLVGIAQKLELTKLEILVGDDEGRYLPGDLVYVRGESAKDLWASPIALNGLEVILVPFDAIVAWEAKKEEEENKPVVTLLHTCRYCGLSVNHLLGKCSGCGTLTDK